MMKTVLVGFLMAALLAGGTTVFAKARDDIHATAEDAQPLLPGMKAPAFVVMDVHGQPVEFDPDAMDKPLILTFFRGGWCPYCNLNLSELRHAEKELREMGFDLWFISIDRPAVLAESLDEPEIEYTMLSDSKLHATRAFGIAFTVDEETHQRYLRNDINLEEASGEPHHVLPVPSTYIIGIDGMINFQYTNVDYHVRLDPTVLMAAARAYKEDSDQRLRKRRDAQRKREK